MEPETGTAPSPTASEPHRASLPGRAVRFVGRHPTGVAQGIFVALVAIIVLQNLEPTSIDVLFWSVTSLPKLVLILVAMLLGGVTWEIARRLLTR
jgi:uncharacterized integral membrane protein